MWKEILKSCIEFEETLINMIGIQIIENLMNNFISKIFEAGDRLPVCKVSMRNESIDLTCFDFLLLPRESQYV
jgi:hypothetical protein